MREHPLPPRPEPRGGLVSALKRTLLDQVTAGGLALRPANEVDIPGYTLGSCISAGGMGEVWTAHDGDGQRFAVKLLKRSLLSDAESRRRFLREGAAVASLTHPGIVDIVDVGVTHDDRPFIVMELLEGPTLRDYIREHAPVSWELARKILMDVAEAVEAAHACGIIHRDIKPANIVLDRELDPASCTVIDFGLARRQGNDGDSTQLTVQGQLLGTPAYMSPEALRGSPTDHHTDIYALGCIAYELLEGVRPFDGDSFAELMLQHLTEPVPSPMLPTVTPELREQVAAVISCALRKRPENRFPTMAQFTDAIARIEPGGPAIEVVEESVWPLARPSTTLTAVDRELPSAPSRWSGRRGVMLLVLGVGIGGGVVALAREDAPPTPSAAAATAPMVPADPEPAVPPRIRDVVGGVSLTCALDEFERVSCWGSDSRGRLGRGGRGSHVGDNDVPAQFPVLGLPPGKNVVDLVANSSGRHVCLHWDDGRARCWGGNLYGQLGLGSTEHWGTVAEETVAALPDLPFEGIEQVAVGPRNTCLLLASGHVHCLGEGKYGARGDGTTDTWGDDEDAETLRGLPRVDVGPRTFTTVSLGRDHACGLLDDGTVRCWGSNERGQLGVRDWTASIGDGVGDGRGRGLRPDDDALKVQELDQVGVTAVQAAWERSCVITAEQSVRCWGGDAHGVLGYPRSLPLQCASTSAKGKCDLDTPPPFDVDLGNARIVALSLGQGHSCALDDEGAVRCWGATNWGRLGDGSSPGDTPPMLPSARTVDLGDFDHDGRPDPAVQVELGSHHGCAVMQDGGVRCWGRGQTGRLGYASSDNIGDDETPAQYYEAQGYAAVNAFPPR